MKSLLIKKFLIKKYGLNYPAFVIFFLTTLSSLVLGQIFILMGITTPFHRGLLVFPLTYLIFTLMVRYWTYSVVPLWNATDIPLNEKILKHNAQEEPYSFLNTPSVAADVPGLGIILYLIFILSFILCLFYWGSFFLAEIAFEFVLAAKLSKALKKVDQADFINSFFHKTLPAFLIIWGLCMIFIKMVEIKCPERVSLIEIYKKGCEIK